MKGMTFELFVYRAQMFAVKLQNRQPKNFFDTLKMSFGATITQFLMGICFGKIMMEGEKQWRKRNNVQAVTKKSEPQKPSARSVT